MRMMILFSGWLLAAGVGVLELWPGEALVAATEVMPAQCIDGGSGRKEKGGGKKLRRENTMLRLQVASLEGNVEQLRHGVLRAEAAARRYRSGLDRAVAELNRPAAKPLLRRRKKPMSRRAEAPSLRLERDQGVLRSVAQIRTLGEEVMVSGRLLNPRPEFLTGTVWIELLHDERVIETASYLAEIGGREKHEYAAKFYAYGYHGGTFSARARFEP